MGIEKSFFWQLVEQEHDRARAFCFRLAGNAEDGDDLYQEAIIRSFHGLGGLRKPESFRFWLYKIIGNVYKSRFRSPWWKRLVFGTNPDSKTAPVDDPSGLYAARRRLEWAMAALSRDDRWLVMLCELEGWKIAEAAAMMSMSEGQIKMRLARAKKKMRQRLSALYEEKSNNKIWKTKSYELSAGSQKTE